MKTTFTVHMMVEGKWLMDQARQRYWFEDAEENGFKLLKESLRGISDELVMKILNGDAIMSGWSVCGKNDCTQCKGKTQIVTTVEPDEQFKNEINERTLWFNEGHYKVGQYHIEKRLVNNYVEELLNYNNLIWRELDLLLPDSELLLELHRKAFWSTRAYGIPSPDYIPEKGSPDYDFTKAINPFLKKLKEHVGDKITTAYSVEDVVVPFMSDYLVLDSTESDFLPKEMTHAGYIQIKVPEPENDYKPKSITLPKEHLLNYLQERLRGEKAMKFTKSLENTLTKEQVLKRYKNLQLNQGHAHTMLMESMNLRHSISGAYPDSIYEYYVNEVVQWIVINNIVSFKDEIKPIPSKIELKFKSKKNKNIGVMILDGKVEDRELELR